MYAICVLSILSLIYIMHHTIPLYLLNASVVLWLGGLQGIRFEFWQSAFYPLDMEKVTPALQFW